MDLDASKAAGMKSASSKDEILEITPTTFVGIRDGPLRLSAATARGICSVLVKRGDKSRHLQIKASQKLRNHSEGFEWSYCGSGPAQLALALLLAVTDKETALQRYQDFKRDAVSKMPEDGWELDAGEILAWLSCQDDKIFRKKWNL